MKDIRVGCWHERKFVLSPAEEHRYAPHVVGLMLEATYDTLEEAKQGAVDELEWLKAQVTAEVQAQQQAARGGAHEALMKIGPDATFDAVEDYRKPSPDDVPFGEPKDPAEVPDAEVWYAGAKGKYVSDLSLDEIEWYLSSDVVLGARKDDQRVKDFVDALVFWRDKKGGM